MRPLSMSVIALACVLGGTFLGIFLRNRLPEHHLSAATKDVVRLGTGLIGTIAGLVLGLLIASANSTSNSEHSSPAVNRQHRSARPHPGAVRAGDGFGPQSASSGGRLYG